MPPPADEKAPAGGAPSAAGATSTTVVVATRDRRERLLGTLDRLAELPERPPVVVVDNGSSDGGPSAVRERHPEVLVLELGENRGAAARNEGVRAAATPHVAFSDDDSWWQPGALARAARLLDAHPRVALVAARILVGDERRVDPTSRAMAQSPLDRDPLLPGPRVLGFVACGAVARRRAFLDVGGFERLLGVGGEESLLALDLAAAGHELVYDDGVVAHHHPAAGSRAGRGRLQARNRLIVSWLRRPVGVAARETARPLLDGGSRREAALAAIDAIRAAPWIARERRRVPAALERSLRTLERPA